MLISAVYLSCLAGSRAHFSAMVEKMSFFQSDEIVKRASLSPFRTVIYGNVFDSIVINRTLNK